MQNVEACGVEFTGLVAEVGRMIEAHGLLPDGGGVLVGLSGGADSVALLTALKRLAPYHNWRVAAAHFNHGIRGETASRDERFCRELCDGMGVEFVAERADVPACAAEQGVSVETAGRLLRYDFLERTRVWLGLDRIAVAHHMDDNAESVLMHLFRGSGLAGLTGIQPMRGSIIRPLLGVRRADIEDFLNSEGLLYCTDETNLAPEGTRNRLRLEVIPYLERHVNPALVPTLCSTAELLMEDEAYLAEISQYELEAARQGEGFLRERLAALDKPIAARVIRLALAEVGAVVDIERVHIEAVMELLTARTGASAVLPHARAFTSYELICFAPAGEEEEIPDFACDITGVGEYATPFGKFTVSIVGGSEIQKSRTVAYMDMDKLDGALSIRARREGDRFYPLGAPGRRKLKDIFIDRKLDRRKRDRLPLVVCGSEALFVPGIGVSETVRVDGSTARMLRVEYSPAEEE